MHLPVCPSPAELSAYLDSTMPADRRPAISEHLYQCSACRKMVRQIVDEAAGNGKAEPVRPAAAVPTAHPVAAQTPQLAAVATPLVPPTPPPAALDVSPASVACPGQLGPYRLLEKVGGGSAGNVYKAQHTALQRIVALKVLADEQSDDPVLVSRFRREMRVVGQLNHPHIVRATDGGEIDGVHYLAMDFVEGIDLYRLVKTLQRLPIPDACELARQAAVGLQHAHEHGLVHRDVKPPNLILDRTGTVKILDLGIARCTSPGAGEEGLTIQGEVMGTVDYMAPEQAADAASADIRADVYGLGCTLYHLVAGKPPFSGPAYRTLPAKLMGHKFEAAPPLRSVRPEAPAALEAVLGRMLAKDPAGRYATPAQAAAALEPLARGCDLPALLSSAGLTPSVSGTHSLGGAVPQSHGSFWRRLLAGALAVLVVLGRSA